MKRFILSLFVCIALNTAYARADTFGNILYHVRADIIDSTATYKNTALGDALIKSRINRVQEQIVAYTNAISSRTLTSPTTNQMEYDLPSNFVDIQRVGYTEQTGSTTTYKRLDRLSMAQLDIKFPSWDSNDTSTSSRPLYYYIRANKIGLYPKPSGSYCQANSIKIDYYKKPGNMVNSTDEPYDGLYKLREFHHVVTVGTVAWCRRTLGLDNSASLKEYTFWLEFMKDKLKNPVDAGGIIETEKDYDRGGFR